MVVNFTGAQGTGKTTMLNMAKGVFNEKYKYITEVVRDLKKTKNIAINEKGDDNSQIAIFNVYMNNLILEKNNYISDRCIIDVVAYSKYLYDCGYLTKEVLDAQEQLVKYAINANILGEIIYFPIEFQLVNDGVRSMNVDFQKTIDENIKFYLDKFNIAHKTIKGTIEQRFNFICELLK